MSQNSTESTEMGVDFTKLFAKQKVAGACCLAKNLVKITKNILPICQTLFAKKGIESCASKIFKCKW
jgi:hypothetical protein